MQPDKQPAPTIHYRNGLPSWNVKVYRSPTAEECKAVAEEQGIDPAALARQPGGPVNVYPTMPFGPAWIEAYAERDPEGYCAVLGDTASDGFEHAREYARELFGDRADVFQEGSSGGWLVLHHPSVTGAEIDAAEEYLRLAEDEPSNPILDDVTVEELLAARELLDNLDKFGHYVAACVEYHPRAQAWNLAQVFQVCAEDYAAEQAEKQADERLARARTAFEDAATRLRDAALAVTLHGPASPMPFGFAVDDLCPAVDAFEAARLELERAKGGAS